MSEVDFPYTNILLQYCAVLRSTVQYCTVLYKNICVGKIGFGHEKKLRWGLSTRVLNFVGGIKKQYHYHYWPVFPEGS